jgi:hypothetical protein
MAKPVTSRRLAPMQIECSEEQFAKAESPMAEIAQPGSKSNRERFGHIAKQDGGITSINDGKQMCRSDEQVQNTDSPRVESREPHSKVTAESFSQTPKQDCEIVSMDEGRQMD